MDLKVLFGSVVRHGLGALGALLVAHGYVSPDDVAGLVEAVSGAVVAVGVVGWSYWSKKSGK